MSNVCKDRVSCVKNVSKYHSFYTLISKQDFWPITLVLVNKAGDLYEIWKLFGLFIKIAQIYVFYKNHFRDIL